MDDRVDLVLGDDARDEFCVADVADDQFRLGRDRPFKAGRQAVEDDDLLARIDSRLGAAGAPLHAQVRQVQALR